jgi:hypothetical protein
MKNLFAFPLFVALICGTLYSDDLSFWETGGMYFCVPYEKGTLEFDVNLWYEDDEPGLSLFGSYAVTDHFTLKLDVPATFVSPFFSGFKASALYGMQNESSDLTLSGDVNMGCYFGEGWSEFAPTVGFNAGKRWGIFALIGRISGGLDAFTEADETVVTKIGEAEISPFLYTGDFGMVGTPLMMEYAGDFLSVNIGLDVEIYLPLGISLNFVPRYEVRGESGLSVWAGISWMHIPGE